MSLLSFSLRLGRIFLLAAAVTASFEPALAAPYPLTPGAEFDGMRKLFDTMSKADTVMLAPPVPVWNADESAALMYSRGTEGLVWLDVAGRRKVALTPPSAAASKPEFVYAEKGDFVYFSGGSWWSFSPEGNRFAGLDGEASRRAEKQWDVHRASAASARASAKSARATTLIVRNDYGTEVALYWKSGDGNFVRYGTVPAGDSYEQSTYEGHAWEVRDSSGRVLDRFAVPVDGGVVTVTAQMGSVTKPSRPRRRAEAKPAEFDTRIEAGALVVKSKAGEFVVPATLGQAETLAGSYPSGDGDFVAAVCLTKVPVRKLTYTEKHPKGSDTPRVFSFEYAKPGDAIDTNRVAIFDLKNRKEIAVKNEIFADVWDFRPIGWSPDGGEFVVYLHYRTHKLSRFVGISRDGTVRTIIEEKADSFIDYSQKGWYSVLNGPWQLLWASERDGRNHLYRFDLKTGALLNRVTSGDYIVRSVENVDEGDGSVLFSALAVRPGEDPYYTNLMRARIDGSAAPVVLTEGDGLHSWWFSPSRKYLVDRWSRVDLPPNFALRETATGTKVCDLVTRTAADIPSGYVVPERFTAKGRDGKTDIYGVIYRPSSYKKGDRLPVIEFIYAGPHGFNVPKAWGERDMYMRLSEQGYAVVVIDGMGTNWRDRAFHDVCWMNIKDAGYPDRIAWIKAAAAKYPELDISKVGVIGGSAGGQNAAAALIWHNDFYKVAVADCGCHDNRIDKIWWNEAWMGWPIGPQYSASSNIDNAAKLKGDILLLLGEIDPNVDVVSTYYLADAFKKNAIPYDLYVVPGGGHFVYFDHEAFRRVSAFFHKNIPMPKGR